MLIAILIRPEYNNVIKNEIGKYHTYTNNGDKRNHYNANNNLALLQLIFLLDLCSPTVVQMMLVSLVHP